MKKEAAEFLDRCSYEILNDMYFIVNSYDFTLDGKIYSVTLTLNEEFLIKEDIEMFTAWRYGTEKYRFPCKELGKYIKIRKIKGCL